MDFDEIPGREDILGAVKTATELARDGAESIKSERWDEATLALKQAAVGCLLACYACAAQRDQTNDRDMVERIASRIRARREMGAEEDGDIDFAAIEGFLRGAKDEGEA